GVGQGGALELVGEEPSAEHGQPLLDLRTGVGALVGVGVAGRPAPGVDVTPDLVGQVGDLGRSVPAAQQVVEGEVVKRVRADRALGGLGLLALAGRDQLGAALGVQG